MKIGAVVILYQPELEQTRCMLSSLFAQVDMVCVVDNSPNSSCIPLSLTSYENLKFFHFPENIGIAAAQNVGLQYLIEAGFDYGLLLDQDSHFEEDFVDKLIKLFEQARSEHIPELVAIGPSLICAYTDKILRPSIQGEIEHFCNIASVPQIIASGMMMDLRQLKQIGLKDDSLFIDGVDHEWCWRARKCGYAIGKASNVVMYHKLGDGRRRFAGVTFKIGAPVRLYYQFRNIFLLSRRPYVPNYWKLRNFAVMPLRIFANALLLPNKRARLKFMAYGIIDGILNRSGPISANWAE
ncbi:glycosyltransferase family 2 protein [Bowmanella denitrificans]|uniref:glycosyltransferase family 2 protein n=1 Tax=Bowmanella denitrificans TaxID=366582 RepID=UPI001FE2E5DC|nr:glycosyltransferase family 2 protein [Bowmanella denitrificans]